jgi:ParB family chromosome partitioning protein
MKLEMAIIENLQREDLNPVDRAQAFHQLINEFSLKHVEVAKKIGKSREYVSNTIRILVLPQAMLDALVAGQITEGHTRPLLMLMDRPGEQETLFRDIMSRRITVRDAENIARRIAFEKMRKKERFIEPQIIELEQALSERLGTRVMVENNPRTENGKITIDFFDREGMIKILTELSAEHHEQSEPAEAPEDSILSDEALPATSDPDDDLYSVRNFSL